MAAGAPARIAAFRTLQQVRAGRRFATAIDEAAHGLSDADRRLVHEIAAGVLRSRDELDRAVRPLTTATWSRVDPDVRDLLHVGAYQLRYLDRIPPYAALSATVQAAKQAVGRRPAGMVNAVLRRVARGEPEDSPPPLDLAARFSHPRWLVERWRRTFGDARTTALLQHNNRRPPLTLRPVRWSREELRTGLDAAGVPHREAAFPPGVIVEASDVRALPGYAEGAFVVQDAAQSSLVALVPPGMSGTTWDACAAPGGKAAVLAASGVSVIASDRTRERVAQLRQTLTRVAPQTVVLVADARHPPLPDRSCAVVLVDAPCSATGTIARHPDARWRLSPATLTRLVETQASILNGVARVVAVGGALVYLTCSLEPEENRMQVEQFLAQHTRFCQDGADMSIFPADAETDGGYGIRMRRVS